MPAPLDLTGRRFGALVALKRTLWKNGRAAWICRCDCGRETTVPLNRLSIPDQDRRAIRACESCRSRRCPICGALYLKSGSAMTCGAPACRQEYRRAVNANHAARMEALHPGEKVRRQRVYRSSIKLDAAQYAAILERDAAAARERRRTRSKERGYLPEYYAAHREAIRARYRRWLDEMSPDRKSILKNRQRKATTSYRARRRLTDLAVALGALTEKRESDDE